LGSICPPFSLLFFLFFNQIKYPPGIKVQILFCTFKNKKIKKGGGGRGMSVIEGIE